MRTPFSGFSFSNRSRICADDRHLAGRPVDPPPARVGEPVVPDVVSHSVPLAQKASASPATTRPIASAAVLDASRTSS